MNPYAAMAAIKEATAALPPFAPETVGLLAGAVAFQTLSPPLKFHAPDMVGLPPTVPLMVGAVIDGEVARTMLPVPVGGCAKAAATPLPRPVMPVTGRPVAFVRIAADGVPRFGVCVPSSAVEFAQTAI